MKAKIHPQYFENIKITCSCGNVLLVGSTKKEIHTEICSACHPFYTGQQKLVDTAGRVDKFMARVKKAEKMKEKEEKKVTSELDKLYEEPAQAEGKKPMLQSSMEELKAESQEVETTEAPGESAEVETDKPVKTPKKTAAKKASKKKA